VVIDALPECVPDHRSADAIVAVDVFRTTTMALTAVEAGWRCFVVPTLEEAVEQAQRLDRPLLAGELGGSVPFGFDLDNSPAALTGRDDQERPIVLLSTAGTRVICGAGPNQAVYAASLRNWTAQVRHLVGRHERVALIGAGARGEFRAEDAQCCAWIAAALVDAGFDAGTETRALIERWRDTTPRDVIDGPSAAFLRTTGRQDDIDFVVAHVDDTALVLRLDGGELVRDPAPDLAARPAGP
jgi:2-phosphosulfolactate phosphatase